MDPVQYYLERSLHRSQWKCSLIKHLIKEDRCWMLFDGLDELGPVEQAMMLRWLQGFMAERPNALVMLTSRHSQQFHKELLDGLSYAGGNGTSCWSYHQNCHVPTEVSCSQCWGLEHFVPLRFECLSYETVEAVIEQRSPHLYDPASHDQSNTDTTTLPSWLKDELKLREYRWSRAAPRNLLVLAGMVHTLKPSRLRSWVVRSSHNAQEHLTQSSSHDDVTTSAIPPTSIRRSATSSRGGTVTDKPLRKQASVATSDRVALLHTVIELLLGVACHTHTDGAASDIHTNTQQLSKAAGLCPAALMESLLQLVRLGAYRAMERRHHHIRVRDLRSIAASLPDPVAATASLNILLETIADRRGGLFAVESFTTAVSGVVRPNVLRFAHESLQEVLAAEYIAGEILCAYHGIQNTPDNIIGSALLSDASTCEGSTTTCRGSSGACVCEVEASCDDTDLSDCGGSVVFLDCEPAFDASVVQSCAGDQLLLVSDDVSGTHILSDVKMSQDDVGAGTTAARVDDEASDDGSGLRNGARDDEKDQGEEEEEGGEETKFDSNEHIVECSKYHNHPFNSAALDYSQPADSLCTWLGRSRGESTGSGNASDVHEKENQRNQTRNDSSWNQAGNISSWRAKELNKEGRQQQRSPHYSARVQSIPQYHSRSSQQRHKAGCATVVALASNNNTVEDVVNVHRSVGQEEGHRGITASTTSNKRQGRMRRDCHVLEVRPVETQINSLPHGRQGVDSECPSDEARGEGAKSGTGIVDVREEVVLGRVKAVVEQHMLGTSCNPSKYRIADACFQPMLLVAFDIVMANQQALDTHTHTRIQSCDNITTTMPRRVRRGVRATQGRGGVSTAFDSAIKALVCCTGNSFGRQGGTVAQPSSVSLSLESLWLSACAGGKVNVVKGLLKRVGGQRILQAVNADLDNALHLAAMHDRIEVIRLIMAQDEVDAEFLDRNNKHG
jgi:hypothetical protein